MATNLALDDELIGDAQRLGCHKTKKEAVTAALKEYVRQKRLEQLFALMGRVEWDIDPAEIRKEERRRAGEAERLWAEE
jgi:Arc/MetJ family transcription regulator